MTPWSALVLNTNATSWFGSREHEIMKGSPHRAIAASFDDAARFVEETASPKHTVEAIPTRSPNLADGKNSRSPQVNENS